MASIRIGLGSEFNLNNSNLGLGVTNPQVRLDVDGTVKSKDFEVTGVTSFTAYEGFLRSDHQIDGDLTLKADQGLNASLSGEIIVKDGVTVTVGAVGLGTTEVGIGTDNSVGIGTTTNQKGTTTIDSNVVNLAGGSEIECLKVYNTFTPPNGGTNERPYAPKPGELYYNYDLKTIEFFDGYGWRQVDNTTRSGRGVFGGGSTPTTLNVIDYVTIPSLGNAIDFGDFTSARQAQPSGGSNGIRGLFGGGSPNTGQIDYITIASAGNAISYGDLSSYDPDFPGGCSSSTRYIVAGGRSPAPGNTVSTIQYVEISTLGNGQTFGDLSVARHIVSGCASPTRGLFGAGRDDPGNFFSVIDQITIASTGDAIDFGDLTNTRGLSSSSFSNSIRGVWGGGYAPNNSPAQAGSGKIIDYVTIASRGNAVNFGDLTTEKYGSMGAATQTRGLFASGATSSSRTNGIDYITIQTTGNAIDFGDSSVARRSGGGLSDSHGGLGGF